MRHRWMNKLRAEMGGYFWLPCPVCGRYFGGHEWRDRDGMCSAVPDYDYERDAVDAHQGTGICPDCTQDGFGWMAWEDPDLRFEAAP